MAGDEERDENIVGKRPRERGRVGKDPGLANEESVWNERWKWETVKIESEERRVGGIN